MNIKRKLRSRKNCSKKRKKRFKMAKKNKII